MSDEFDATLDRIDPQTDQVDRVVSPGKLAAGHGGGRVRRLGRGAAVRRGQPPRRHLDRGERLTCLQPDPAQAYDLGEHSGARHRLRRSGRVPPVGRRGRAHARPGPGHDAAAPGRRRHDVHVHAPPGNPLLQRHARAGVRLPPRHPAPAQLRRPYPDYYEGILGAPACHQHPRRCDLSAGIVTDDAAGTVTFRLGQADPDFLYKLALLLAAPAPPGAPGHAHQTARRSCPAPART